MYGRLKGYWGEVVDCGKGAHPTQRGSHTMLGCDNQAAITLKYHIDL
jgi:hypothetical protein